MKNATQELANFTDVGVKSVANILRVTLISKYIKKLIMAKMKKSKNLKNMRKVKHN